MKFLKRRKKHSEELNVFSITKAVRIFRLKKKKYFRKKLSNETCHIVTVVFSRVFFSLIFYLCQFFRGQFNLLLWIFKIWMELGRDQNVWISFFFFSRFFSFLLFYLEALRHLEWSQSHWQWASSASTASAASSICSTACCSACSCWHSCIWSVSASEAATL